jgi:hypothetical protein
MMVCLTCGLVPYKIEHHHIAARVNGLPQTDVTAALCVPCHRIVSRWQAERWRRGDLLPARFESWSGWSDLMHLSAIRAGSASTRGWSRAERSLWRRFSAATLPKPLATVPREIEVTTAALDREPLWSLLYDDPVNLYQPWLALAVASDAGYGCWITFVNDDGTVVNYPDVRPAGAPQRNVVRPVSTDVLAALLDGWPDRPLGEIEVIEL